MSRLREGQMAAQPDVAAQPTRRGFLSFLAVAAPAAALAGSDILSTAENLDWRTKPVDRWTKDDEVAEARFHVHALRGEYEASPQGSRSRAVAAIKLDWWENHLASLARSRG